MRLPALTAVHPVLAALLVVPVVALVPAAPAAVLVQVYLSLILIWSKIDGKF